MKENATWKFDAKVNTQEALEVTGDALPDSKVAKANGKSDVLKASNDAFSISKGTFTQPATPIAAIESFTLSADDLVLELQGTDFVEKGGVFGYKSADGTKSVKIDLTKNYYVVNIKKTDCSGVTPSDGIDVYVTINSYLGGTKIHPSQKTMLKYPK